MKFNYTSTPIVMTAVAASLMLTACASTPEAPLPVSNTLVETKAPADATETAPAAVVVSKVEAIKSPEKRDIAPPEGVFDMPDSTDVTVPMDGDFFYTVGADDSMSEIAERFTGSAGNWRKLAELNDLPASGVVRPGQKLRIPNMMKVLSVETAEDSARTLPAWKKVTK